MSQEWFPLIATGITALYAVGVLFKIVWDKHEFEEQERQEQRFNQEMLERMVARRRNKS